MAAQAITCAYKYGTCYELINWYTWCRSHAAASAPTAAHQLPTRSSPGSRLLVVPSLSPATSSIAHLEVTVLGCV